VVEYKQCDARWSIKAVEVAGILRKRLTYASAYQDPCVRKAYTSTGIVLCCVVLAQRNRQIGVRHEQIFVW